MAKLGWKEIILLNRFSSAGDGHISTQMIKKSGRGNLFGLTKPLNR